MNDIAPLLLTNLAVSAAFFFVLWLISIALKDPSFVDSWWALGVIVLVAATYLQRDVHTPHAIALSVLGIAWGLRLGLYLLWRWSKHGRDRRYEAMAKRAKEKNGRSFAAFALLWVFLPQMFLQIVMALPVQLGQFGPNVPLDAIAITGAILAAFGILYEAIADAQLAAFKADAANTGKLMDRGLWRYSRHPNYFGELCAWWGMYLIAFETGPVGAWSLPGPLLITFLLTRVSGAPTTEPHLSKTRPEYAEYKRRTSSFIPLPPKRA